MKIGIPHQNKADMSDMFKKKNMKNNYIFLRLIFRNHYLNKF